MWEHMHQFLEQVVGKNKKFVDRHRGENPQYNPGDWVWLAARDIKGLPVCQKLSAQSIYWLLQGLVPVTYQ